jgi:sulfur carrier protein
MTIKLNDKSYEVAEGITLDRFIETLGVPIQGMAIAIAYEVIPKSQWREIRLEDRMELMMIHAVSGG